MTVIYLSEGRRHGQKSISKTPKAKTHEVFQIFKWLSKLKIFTLG